ncbi:MAG: acyl carrier protein [Deltaproteobacteria bacterium]|nr:acyl carrier protein [Deltaproteobacteria bacterium]MBI2342441.1 acyl carrier protein [Deltaproteobacteria bacterium]MBI2974215.1 acyl carrier protein [Deltaproteobacteria bacterium]
MSVEAKVKEIMAEQLGINEEDISSDSSLAEDLGADSLDVVEIVMALEEEFEMEISDSDAEKLDTVKDFSNFISQRSC